MIQMDSKSHCGWWGSVSSSSQSCNEFKKASDWRLVGRHSRDCFLEMELLACRDGEDIPRYFLMTRSVAANTASPLCLLLPHLFKSLSGRVVWTTFICSLALSSPRIIWEWDLNEISLRVEMGKLCFVRLINPL